jgi:hypothetical protein
MIYEYLAMDSAHLMLCIDNITGFLMQYASVFINKINYIKLYNRLCGLVVRVSDYRSGGPGFDLRPYQIFREVEGLVWGPLSLVRTIEELLE